MPAMRALLVVNPKATTTSERGRDILVRALRSEVSLTVAYTRRRGHAATLAAEAASDGMDVVVTLGGDGTVNEAVNGIMRAKPSADAASRPALAVVPGGSTNVFARAMGLPKDWAEGTGVILEARPSPIVRQRGPAGSSGHPEPVHPRRVLPVLRRRRVAHARDHPGARRRAGGAGPRHGHRAEHRPVDVPRRPADQPVTGGLVLSRRPNPRGKRILRLHDLAGFSLRATRPLGFQVDGEFLGERDKVEFAAVPAALRVVC